MMKKIVLYTCVLGITLGCAQPARALNTEESVILGVCGALLAIPAAVYGYNWLSEKMTSDEDALIQAHNQVERVKLMYREEGLILNRADAYAFHELERLIDSIVVSKGYTLHPYYNELRTLLNKCEEAKKRLEKRLSHTMHSSNVYLFAQYKDEIAQLAHIITTLNTLYRITGRLIDYKKDEKFYVDTLATYEHRERYYMQEFQIIRDSSYYGTVDHERLIQLAISKGYTLVNYRYPLINYKNDLDNALYKTKNASSELTRRVHTLYERYGYKVPLIVSYEALLPRLQNDIYCLQKIRDIIVTSAQYHFEVNQKNFEDECRRREEEARELQRKLDDIAAIQRTHLAIDTLNLITRK